MPTKFSIRLLIITVSSLLLVYVVDITDLFLFAVLFVIYALLVFWLVKVVKHIEMPKSTLK